MNINDAKNMLACAEVGSGPSRLNPAMTEIQVRDIVLRGLGPRACEADGVTLLPICEKRVHQVCGFERLGKEWLFDDLPVQRGEVIIRRLPGKAKK